MAGAAAASPGKGGGDDSDDDDRDTADSDSSPDDGTDSDGGEGGGPDDSGSDDSSSSGSDDGGEGGGSDDGGEGGGSDSGSGSSGSGDGGEGGSSGSGSGEGGEGGSSGSSGGSGSSGSGDGGEGGSSGSSGSGSNSGQSANSGRGSVDEDIVTVGRNDAGERIREGEAMVLTSRSDFASLLAAKGFRLVESFRVATISASAIRVAVPKGMSERDALNALQALDPKGIVTFNHIYNPAAAGVVTVPTHTAATKKPAVKAKVGLVDAGVDAKHPMLRQVVVNARSFDQAAHVPTDAHGTAVASLIAEVAPGATVFAANVFTTSADGREIATAGAIVRGLDWLANMHVAVINLSLTGPANPILEAMIGKLNAAGHILVAAVGNEGPRGAPQFPAAYDKVIGVTAVDGRNRVYLYANQGEYVDFAAHGVDLRVADPQGTVSTVSGTSYAAPVVAARLAASLEVPDAARAAKAVELLAAEAHDLGAPGRDPVFGYGLIGD